MDLTEYLDRSEGERVRDGYDLIESADPEDDDEREYERLGVNFEDAEEEDETLP